MGNDGIGAILCMGKGMSAIHCMGKRMSAILCTGKGMSAKLSMGNEGISAIRGYECSSVYECNTV